MKGKKKRKYNKRSPTVVNLIKISYDRFRDESYEIVTSNTLQGSMKLCGGKENRQPVASIEHAIFVYVSLFRNNENNVMKKHSSRLCTFRVDRCH